MQGQGHRTGSWEAGRQASTGLPPSLESGERRDCKLMKEEMQYTLPSGAAAPGRVVGGPAAAELAELGLGVGQE